MTKNLHAHISTASSDCDGPTYTSRVEVFNDDEVAESGKVVNDFSDIHFMNRVMTNVAGPYAVQHQMTVKVDSEGIEVHEDTDEGYRHVEVRWCHDEWCDTTKTSYRDIFAERAGY